MTTKKRAPRMHRGQPAAPPPQPGEIRGNLVYLPEHPLARKTGWLLRHRLAAYMTRNGQCSCDAGKRQMEWNEASVIPQTDTDSLVLCNTHAVVRWLADHITRTGFAGPAGTAALEHLAPLWAAECPAGGSSGTEDRQNSQEVPFGDVPGGSAAPVTTEGEADG